MHGLRQDRPLLTSTLRAHAVNDHGEREIVSRWRDIGACAQALAPRCPKVRHGGALCNAAMHVPTAWLGLFDDIGSHRTELDLSQVKRRHVQCKAGRPNFGVEIEVFGDEGRPWPHNGVDFGELKARRPCVAAGNFEACFARPVQRAPRAPRFPMI